MDEYSDRAVPWVDDDDLTSPMVTMPESMALINPKYNLSVATPDDVPQEEGISPSQGMGASTPSPRLRRRNPSASESHPSASTSPTPRSRPTNSCTSETSREHPHHQQQQQQQQQQTHRPRSPFVDSSRSSAHLDESVDSTAPNSDDPMEDDAYKIEDTNPFSDVTSVRNGGGILGVVSNPFLGGGDEGEDIGVVNPFFEPYFGPNPTHSGFLEAPIALEGSNPFDTATRSSSASNSPQRRPPTSGAASRPAPIPSHPPLSGGDGWTSSPPAAYSQQTSSQARFHLETGLYSSGGVEGASPGYVGARSSLIKHFTLARNFSVEKEMPALRKLGARSTDELRGDADEAPGAIQIGADGVPSFPARPTTASKSFHNLRGARSWTNFEANGSSDGGGGDDDNRFDAGKIGAASSTTASYVSKTGSSKEGSAEFLANRSSTESGRYMLDLQKQIIDLQRESSAIRREMEMAKTRLSDKNSSIKTFWSPELKKERAMRKEDLKLVKSLVRDLDIEEGVNLEYKEKQAEIELKLLDIEKMEEEMREAEAQEEEELKEIQMLADALQKVEEEKIETKMNIDLAKMKVEKGDVVLQVRDEWLSKMADQSEILKEKTSVKKREKESVEAEVNLEDRGEEEEEELEDEDEEEEEERIKWMEEVVEVLKLRLTVEETEAMRNRLESELMLKVKEIGDLKKELESSSQKLEEMRMEHQTVWEQVNVELPEAARLQSEIEEKEGQIGMLEHHIQNLEMQLYRLKVYARSVASGMMSRMDTHHASLVGVIPDLVEDSWNLKCLEQLQDQESVLKDKHEELNQGLKLKADRVTCLNEQLEMFEKQIGDLSSYVDVLKETVNTKDQHTASLYAESEEIRSRLKEKDVALNQHRKCINDLKKDTSLLESEVGGLRTSNDIKERKINVLQRRIENMEDSLQDKNKLMETLKNQGENISTDSALWYLKEELRDKERILAMMKQEKETFEKYMSGRLRTLECNQQPEKLERKLEDVDLELRVLKKGSNELRQMVIVKDAKIAQFEEHLQQLDLRLERFHQEKDKMVSLRQKIENQQTAEAEKKDETTKDKQLREKVGKLESQLGTQWESLRTLKVEAAKLNRACRSLDGEKRHRDRVVRGLREMLYSPKKGLEGSDRGGAGGSAGGGGASGGGSGASTDGTATGADAATSQVSPKLQGKVTKMRQEVDRLRRIKAEFRRRMGHLARELEIKDEELRRLLAERPSKSENLFEMKQEAILAAISEKDANIALLEMLGSNEGVGPPKEEIDRLNEEKETLQQRLKEITQARMKMLQKIEQQQQQQMQHPRMRNRSQSRERIHALDRRHSIDASSGLKGRDYPPSLPHPHIKRISSDGGNLSEAGGASTSPIPKSSSASSKSGAPPPPRPGAPPPFKSGVLVGSSSSSAALASSGGVFIAIRNVEHRKSRLRALVDQLKVACIELGYSVDALPPPPHGLDLRLAKTQASAAPPPPHRSIEHLRNEPRDKLLLELKQREKECARIQDYANMLLTRLSRDRPDIVHRVMSMLECPPE